MLIITVKNSHGIPWLVPVLPFSNKVVFLKNFKHGLCLRPVIPATGESEAGGLQTEGVAGLYRQFIPSLSNLMGPSVKTQSANRAEDEAQQALCWGLGSVQWFLTVQGLLGRPECVQSGA